MIGTPPVHGCKASTMIIRGIKLELLKLLLELGRDSHPNEFVALLIERDGVIEELNMVPGTITGEDSASVFFDMMPLGTHLAGSAHSHPNGVLHPSDADVHFFPRAGRFHLIIGHPYRTGDWQCFGADGEPRRLEVIA
jgi:proteasome lid subunit RPN8/RPN11